MLTIKPSSKISDCWDLFLDDVLIIDGLSHDRAFGWACGWRSCCRRNGLPVPELNEILKEAP